MRRLFGTDGIRGIANEELTAELAMKIGRALVTVLKEGERTPSVIIGCDTRLSSDMLISAMGAGIASGGGKVVECGITTTPAIAYLTKSRSMSAGVMISASHNPYEYNGIKIFGSDGFKLSDELEEMIEAIVLDNSPEPYIATSNEVGRITHDSNALEEYVKFLTEAYPDSLGGMRIGIDTANGSAAVCARRVFTTLGGECYMVSDYPDGKNINVDCGSTSTDNLVRLVKEKSLDLGIAFDGDADRCIAIDERGEIVDGDHIMAILALMLMEEGRLEKNTVVGTVMSNLGFIKFCDSMGINFVSTNVGDRYVLEAMNREGFSLGGEQSGHIILRALATTGDGQLTAVALLSYMKKCGKKLSELAGVMKKYPQYSINLSADKDDKIKFLVDGEIKKMIARAEGEIGGGRIVARPSGTEPLIRLMAEGEDEVVTKKVLENLAKKIEAKLHEP